MIHTRYGRAGMMWNNHFGNKPASSAATEQHRESRLTIDLGSWHLVVWPPAPIIQHPTNPKKDPWAFLKKTTKPPPVGHPFLR